MRRVLPTPLCAAGAVRCMNEPGWRNKQSTKDQRTREQKEVDRRDRQIDKLPKPVAMHDHQYPFNKTILSDRALQPIVFEGELDTPHLFNPEPPADFFLYWNVDSFATTSYPPCPDVDYRCLPVDSPAWQAHRELTNRMLRKHEVIPQILGSTPQNANLSCVWSGTGSTRATKDENDALVVASPETSLNRRNFWFTSHLGNYIDLHELQQPPSVFFTVPETDKDSLYTLVIACPDYPYRTNPNEGFLLNYMVSNISASGDALSPKTGTEVASYIPPLPTEDGGTVRQMCMLFKQSSKVDLESTQPVDVPFEERSNFRLHESNSKLRNLLPSLSKVEAVVESTPAALSFFTTKWDIQVQEYYHSIGEAEPAFSPDESDEALLQYLAAAPESMRIRSRYLADGSRNDGGNMNFWGQRNATNLDNTASTGLSQRTFLGADRKPLTRANAGQFTL